MWSVVKITVFPGRRSFVLEDGALASLPRKEQPRILVIRTSKVSALVWSLPVKNVSRTTSPRVRARISCRSSTSSIPSRRRISSMFSRATLLRMVLAFGLALETQ
jgi:hypothetical protein